MEKKYATRCPIKKSRDISISIDRLSFDERQMRPEDEFHLILKVGLLIPRSMVVDIMKKENNGKLKLADLKRVITFRI